MAHKKRTDYTVEEVKQDYWVCDFCNREVVNERNIHVFGIDPALSFNESEADQRLVWMNKDEGRTAVEQATSIDTTMEGHICDECIKDANLRTGQISTAYKDVLHKLGVK